MRQLAAVLTVTLALVPSLVAAGPTAPAVALAPAADVEAWLSLARKHEPGIADASLMEVMGWRRDRLDRILQIALRVPDLTRLEHPLSLHTDIAIAQGMDERAPASGDVAVEVVDGRKVRVLSRSFHWAIARQIAGTLAKRHDAAARVAAWYRATAAVLQEVSACDVLEAHLEAAHSVVGRDPLLALYQGTLHQTYADPRLQRYARRTLAEIDPARRAAMLRGDRTTADLRSGRVGGRMINAAPGGRPRLPRAAKAELGDAEAWLRRALALAPTLVEARIRLAHVLSASGEDAQAVALLGGVDGAALPRFSAFYAAMVLGRSEEHLGHYAEAGDAYTRAAALFPGTQSVEIGRSRAALAQGRAAEALTTVTAVASPDSPERADPWTAYFRLHDPSANLLLQAWRAGLK
jgi:hypothetical protein